MISYVSPRIELFLAPTCVACANQAAKSARGCDFAASSIMVFSTRSKSSASDATVAGKLSIVASRRCCVGSVRSTGGTKISSAWSPAKRSGCFPFSPIRARFHCSASPRYTGTVTLPGCSCRSAGIRASRYVTRAINDSHGVDVDSRNVGGRSAHGLYLCQAGCVGRVEHGPHRVEQEGT